MYNIIIRITDIVFFITFLVSIFAIWKSNKNKILFHSQEYDWEDFSWKYFCYSENPNSSRPQGKYIIEFTGTNQDNVRIKNKLEFEKIKGEEKKSVELAIHLIDLILDDEI